jgi:hypothetical protein
VSDVPASSKYQFAILREARRKLGISLRTKLYVFPEESGFRLVKEPSFDEVGGLFKGMQVCDSEIRNEAMSIC